MVPPLCWYEKDSIDFALNKGYKIENLSEKGKQYEEKRILELTPPKKLIFHFRNKETDPNINDLNSSSKPKHRKT